MGQNLDCGVAQPSGSVSTLQIVKTHIPFTKLPSKANFNYINPVTFQDDVPQNIPTLPSINQLQMLHQLQPQKGSLHLLRTLEKVKSIKEIKVKWNSFIKMKQKDYLKDYDIIKNVIGRGGFGVVRKVKSKYTQQLRVAKVVRKKLMKQDDVTKLFTELYIMKMLDHPNIVKLYEVYDYEQDFILIIQMCTGGQVYTRTKKKKMSEQKAAGIIKQVLRSLIYMHKLGIVHRDIKPENMLFQNQEEKVVKLIDFGIAKKVQNNDFLTDRIGTPTYIAPEIIYKQYNEKCDIWATGVSFYMFVSGKAPFTGEDDQEMMREILRSQAKMEGSVWDKISPDCKEVIKLMLTKKVDDRPSAIELFNHRFFANINESQNSSGQDKKQVIENFHAFHFKNKLQAVVQTFIASQLLTNEQKQVLVKVFRQIDVNNDGVISTEQLRQALTTKSKMSPERVESMMRVIDINGSGSIEYTEFLVANYDSTIQMTKERLKHVFQYFDTDKNGRITYSEVAEFLEDYQSSEEEIKRIFLIVDKNGDGHISQDEFIDLLVSKISSITEIKLETSSLGEQEKESKMLEKRKEVERRLSMEKERARKFTFQGVAQLSSFKPSAPVSKFANK